MLLNRLNFSTVFMKTDSVSAFNDEKEREERERGEPLEDQDSNCKNRVTKRNINHLIDESSGKNKQQQSSILINDTHDDKFFVLFTLSIMKRARKPFCHPDESEMSVMSSQRFPIISV